MRSKMMASVSPPASATSAKENNAEKGEKPHNMTAQTLQDLYKRLVQRLSVANMSHTMKRNLKIAGIVVACLLVVSIALPFLINVNTFRPKLESEASSALGRQVTVGNLTLSILSGSIGAENIAIADDPTFSNSPFVTAKSLKAGVELMPLIFSKQLNVTDITLDAPQITVLKTNSG